MKNILLVITGLVFILSACGIPATPTLEPTIVAHSTNLPVTNPTVFPVTPSTFSKDEKNNPDLTWMATRINVKNDRVTAIFYFKDVPPELMFDKDSIAASTWEYILQICVNTDNDTQTGIPEPFAGADYCLSATHVKVSNIPKTLPIEQGMQVNVEKLGVGGGNISNGNIALDSENNTITLFGEIPGITALSQFYYNVYAGTGNYMDISGQLSDQIFIEN